MTTEFLRWDVCVVPATYVAHGKKGVYLILHNTADDSAKLWLMDPEQLLCMLIESSPLTEGLRYTEVPPCGCNECPDGFASAAAIAQVWEEEP